MYKMINLFNWVTTLVDSFTFYGGGKGGGGGGGSSQPVDFFGRDTRAPYENLLGQLLGVRPLQYSGGTTTTTTPISTSGSTPTNYPSAFVQNLINLLNGKSTTTTAPTTTTTTGGQSILDFIKNQPGYQFGYNQGIEGVNRSFNAQGVSLGGNRGIALQNYGNQYAGGYYNNLVNNLMGASAATLGTGNSSVQNPQLGSSPFGQILGTGLGMWGQSGFGGLFGGAAASTAAGGLMTSTLPALGGLAFSDRLLKRDIKLVNIIKGHKIYNYKYIWSNQEYQGVMAQDVIKINKDAVTVNKNGYYLVNYSKLGV